MRCNNEQMSSWHAKWWGKVSGIEGREPEELRGRFYASILVIAVGIVLGGTVALRNGLWSFKSAPEGMQQLGCRCQLAERSRNETRVLGEIALAKHRKAVFAKALPESEAVRNSHFADARARMVEEAALIEKGEAQLTWYQVRSLRDSLWLLAGIFLAPLLLSFGAGRLMLWHGAQAVGGGRLKGWKSPYVVIAAAGAASIIGRELFMNTLAQGDQIRFTWMSFCISPGAWLSMCLTYIGLGMAVAYPASIIWCYCSAERRPVMDAQACDGAWGVGGYVLFLQAWSVAIFLFVIAGAVA